jgi:hypothetical protein
MEQARAGMLTIRLSCRSHRQNDFAKRPILYQVTQGFACFGEAVDPLDDRLD